MSTQEKEKLRRIVQLRTKFMRKKWSSTWVDFSHKTFITVGFNNSESDFRETRFPADIDLVISIQQQKLMKDIAEFVEGKDNLDEMLEVMVG